MSESGAAEAGVAVARIQALCSGAETEARCATPTEFESEPVRHASRVESFAVFNRHRIRPLRLLAGGAGKASVAAECASGGDYGAAVGPELDV